MILWNIIKICLSHSRIRLVTPRIDTKIIIIKWFRAQRFFFDFFLEIFEPFVTLSIELPATLNSRAPLNNGYDSSESKMNGSVSSTVFVRC